MALTNRDQVGKALDLLQQGLAPFIEREVQSGIEKQRVGRDALSALARSRNQAKSFPEGWDAAALLGVMLDLWDPVFRFPLGNAERSLIHALKAARNRWAHQQTFSGDEAFRALDDAERLLAAVSASQAAQLVPMKDELLRLRYEERARDADRRRKRKERVAEGPVEGLKPWRDVITPHEDVRGGAYQQAEFAADLHAVHDDAGAVGAEYGDPGQFFRRTHLTAGLRALLTGGVRRLSGVGGDPVVDLQTNFGGGKTHSMLALYHLFSGKPASDLYGVDNLLSKAEITELPSNVRRVVLVGNRISPGSPQKKPDGVIVRTLWGELAWQLGGPEAFARIRTDDEKATNPGAALGKLLERYGPALILVDEWVAYARQLQDRSDLPGGSFETQFSFAQALTETVKQAKNCLLVISLPASSEGHASSDDMDEEVGGVRGRQALDKLRNVLGRVASSWKPATSEEGFEIVRRRLFENMPGSHYKHRDQTARRFAEYYREGRADFPRACSEVPYRERIESAYPIHPEVFDRLYEDWASRLRFQRTRGVLRLMAAVIHSLWESNDQSPLILPSMIPLDPGPVRSELLRYLEDPWDSILDQDVDGDRSLPLEIDKSNANFGRVRAAGKVARTIFLGSAPKQKAAQQGIEARRIRLGCAIPGQRIAVYEDALRRLTERGTYLYADGSRYWYDIQPTVTKLARDRAQECRGDDVAQEVGKRLREEAKRRGDFAAIHAAPRESGDVPDETRVRLVILSTDTPCVKGEGDDPAVGKAQKILEWRGNAPREFRNTLLFLAADKTRSQDLEGAVRRLLAWRSVVDDADRLNLAPSQRKQAEARRDDAERGVEAQLRETYCWLLAPKKTGPQAPVTWEALRLKGSGGLVERVAVRARKEELLITQYGATLLRRDLDRVPLWDGDHVSIRKLVHYYAQLLERPRLAGPEVLAETITQGLGLLSWKRDTFGFAESYDEGEGRYVGVSAGQAYRVTPDSPGVLVRPEAVAADREPGPVPPPDPPIPPPPVPTSRRFFGSVALDPGRIGPDAARVAEEVIAHLSGQIGADVQVTLEVSAERSEGFPEDIVRIVRENSQSLRFAKHGFEDE